MPPTESKRTEEEEEPLDSEDECAEILYGYPGQAQQQCVYIECSDSDVSTAALEEMFADDLDDHDSSDSIATQSWHSSEFLKEAPLPFNSIRTQDDVEEYLDSLDRDFSDEARAYLDSLGPAASPSQRGRELGPGGCNRSLRPICPS